MKRTILILTASALALSSTLAMAQTRGGDYGRGGQGGYSQGGGYSQAGRDDHRGDNNNRGGQQSWQRGQRLADNDRGRDRVVSDWGRYNLRAPPRGYGYYRADNGDILLALLASGLIGQVFSGPQYGGGYGQGGYGYQTYDQGYAGYGGYGQPSYGQPAYGGGQIYRDAQGRPYTVDQYGRSVWVR